MTDAKINLLLKELHSRYAIPRKKAADALVEIGTAAVPGLVALLHDEKHPDAHNIAAQVLEQIGTPEALAALEQWRSQG